MEERRVLESYEKERMEGSVPGLNLTLSDNTLLGIN